MIWSQKGVDGKNYGAGARIYTSKAAVTSGVNKTENQFMSPLMKKFFFRIEFIPTTGVTGRPFMASDCHGLFSHYHRH